MTTVAAAASGMPSERAASTARAAASMAVAGLALLAAACAWAPAAMSVAVVATAAGPHNWYEARYLLSRMPARWGPLRAWFLTAVVGTMLLAVGYVLLAVVPETQEGTLVGLAAWQTLVVVWVSALLWLRRSGGHFDHARLAPAALGLVAAAWLAPLWVSVALVFAHPLAALVFVDRELAVRRSPWHAAWRQVLVAVPVLTVGIWLLTPSSSETFVHADATRAGAFLLPAHAARPLLATHVFLETLHYIAWIVLLPLATGARPWHLRRVPLAIASVGWRRALGGLLACGAAAVLVLWAAFAWDYDTTRHVYFTIAIVHVLAEIPFLVRPA